MKVSFYSAGHILGSAMILMEFEGVRYLYTGDYKLQRDPTCDPIELVNADVLITESTFATPETAHPDPEKEIRKLNETPYSVLLGVYSLGKAQRINALINSFVPTEMCWFIVPLRIYTRFTSSLVLTFCVIKLMIGEPLGTARKASSISCLHWSFQILTGRKLWFMHSLRVGKDCSGETP